MCAKTLQETAIESTVNTLQQLGFEIKKIDSKESLPDNIVHIQIEFTGDVKGYVILEMSPELSCDIANTMLAGMMTVDGIDDMCKSVLGEICNMISGNLSNNISTMGYASDIKPPLVDMRDKPLDVKYTTTLKAVKDNNFINAYFLLQSA